MTERRRFLRFETALNAFCEIISEKMRLSSKVRNISKDGALVVLTKPLKQGSQLNLAVDVPGDNVPIFTACEVAWQKEIRDSNADSTFETGLKFNNMDNIHKARLLEYIYARWLKLIDKE